MKGEQSLEPSRSVIEIKFQSSMVKLVLNQVLYKVKSHPLGTHNLKGLYGS